MPAPESILALVERFERQRAALRSPAYNETSLRREFLDPFFKALGWDVDNSAGSAEAYKDVVHEDAIKIGTANKAPDYSFRIGGTRKFFVEAKRPSVNIKDDPEPAYQLRRYAWSAKLPLSILTDFEELAVYDCRAKPVSTDRASVHRTLIFKYTEYASRWDELASIFARESVLKGSFDQYAEGKKGRRGTATVDREFLRDIESWREALARNIAIRNPKLDVRDINFAVQRTIDRIIFLRIAEDRGLEEYGRLLALTNGANCYKRLAELFVQADARYNSGLFHFRKEKDRAEAPDDLTLSVTVDDRVVKDVVKALYYPDSPYEFSVVPADILGQVYEQFLGKVIRLTAGHQAKVEEKPEVRKAGGVYYTPTYIVDYIVKETVGKLLEGKSAKQADALRVVDPACGSGSFLIEAYQYLLDWYRDRYLEDGPKKHRKQLFQGPGGAWRLTSGERKRILLNNIYGVDIDAQAVEVTKLSLLLKVLEGESAEHIQHELTAVRERALPHLGNNIKCGNSLIGPDFYDQQELGDLTEDERLRVNAFDWKAEFPEVFKGKGRGFDAVIGNPPYVRMEEFKPLKQYLRAHFGVHNERSDLYAYFIERGHYLLRDSGKFGMIVSNKFLRSAYGAPLRRHVREQAKLDCVVDLAGLPVFAGATVRTIVLLTTRGSPSDSALYAPPMSADAFRALRAGRIDLGQGSAADLRRCKLSDQLDGGWSFVDTSDTALLARLQEGGALLGERYSVGMGIKSGLSDAFVIGRESRSSLIERSTAAAEIIRPFVAGRDIERYLVADSEQWLLYTFRGVPIKKYPSVEKHLVAFRSSLEARATRQEWFELQQGQHAYQPQFEGCKIVFPDMAKRPRFALDHGHYLANTCYFIASEDRRLVGLLNSRVSYFYFKTVCAGLEGAGQIYLRFFGQYLHGFPLPSDLGSDLELLVVEAEKAAQRLARADNSNSRSAAARMVDEIDRRIDQAVYRLYNLTDAEIRIVEDATARPV